MVQLIKQQIKNDLADIETAWKENAAKIKRISDYPALTAVDYMDMETLQRKNDELDIMWKTLSATYANILHIEMTGEID